MEQKTLVNWDWTALLARLSRNQVQGNGIHSDLALCEQAGDNPLKLRYTLLETAH